MYELMMSLTGNFDDNRVEEIIKEEEVFFVELCGCGHLKIQGDFNDLQVAEYRIMDEFNVNYKSRQMRQLEARNG